MIRRICEWLFPRPGYDPDDMQTAAAEDMTAREIASLTAANMALVEQLAESCAERDRLMEREDELVNANLGFGRALDKVCRERDDAREERGRQTANTIEMTNRANRLTDMLETIATLGEASRNGTARKLARIARETRE